LSLATNLCFPQFDSDECTDLQELEPNWQ